VESGEIDSVQLDYENSIDDDDDDGSERSGGNS
jgi:hypothetical protein